MIKDEKCYTKKCDVMSASYKFLLNAAMIQEKAGNQKTAEIFFNLAEMYSHDYDLCT